MSKRIKITLPDDLHEALRNLEYIAEDGVKHNYSMSQKIEKAVRLLILEQKTMTSDAMQWDDVTERQMFEADVLLRKMMEERYRELGEDF